MTTPTTASPDASATPAGRPIRLYDTTLRDGLGMEGLSLSVGADHPV